VQQYPDCAPNAVAGRNVTVVAGVSGTGKSTFALRYLANADLAVRFVFDPDPGEFNPRVGEFSDRLQLPAATDGYSLSLSLCQGWTIFDPHTLFPGRIETAFQFFCEWAWEMSLNIPGEKVIVVDEVWKHCSPHHIPPELAMITQSGRKRGVRLMVTTQEPNRLNSSLLNGVSEFVCFKLQGERALAIAESNGFNRAEVENLPALQFIARNCDSGGELRGAIKV